MATIAAVPRPDTNTKVLLWLLLIIYIFNFIDRQIVNILAESIARDLDLSDTQIGLMTGIAFALFYSVLGLPIARYSDRPSTNRVHVLAAALTAWSVMTAVCGMAQNFVQLLLARIGVGVGEAGCTPVAHSLISDAVPKENRASAIAFYSMGIPIGGLLGLLIGGQLADRVGWRSAFMIVGVPGVILALVVLLALRDPRTTATMARARAQGEAARPVLGTREAIGQLFRSRAYLLMLISGAGSTFLSYGKTTWSAIFFQRTHGMSPGEVGLWLGLGVGLGGAFGTWLGGWLADRFGRHNRRHVLTAPAIGMALASPIAFVAYNATNAYVSIAVLVVSTLLQTLVSGPLFASVQGVVRPEARAMASAVILFAMNLIGLGLGPLFFGIVSDLVKPVAGQESVRWVLGAAAWLGLVPAYFIWRASLRLNAELDQHG